MLAFVLMAGKVQIVSFVVVKLGEFSIEDVFFFFFALCELAKRRYQSFVI